MNITKFLTTPHMEETLYVPFLLVHIPVFSIIPILCLRFFLWGKECQAFDKHAHTIAIQQNDSMSFKFKSDNFPSVFNIFILLSVSFTMFFLYFSANITSCSFTHRNTIAFRSLGANDFRSHPIFSLCQSYQNLASP